jgi:hypothetical protein
MFISVDVPQGERHRIKATWTANLDALLMVKDEDRAHDFVPGDPPNFVLECDIESAPKGAHAVFTDSVFSSSFVTFNPKYEYNYEYG